MATCNACHAEYYLDWKNGGVKLELDKRTKHVCRISGAHLTPLNTRELKIEELALKITRPYRPRAYNN
jgi:hypothetical protein